MDTLQDPAQLPYESRVRHFLTWERVPYPLLVLKHFPLDLGALCGDVVQVHFHLG
jgi:hypothetical protein